MLRATWGNVLGRCKVKELFETTSNTTSFSYHNSCLIYVNPFITSIRRRHFHEFVYNQEHKCLCKLLCNN